MKEVPFSDLVGKIIKKLHHIKGAYYEELRFEINRGPTYVMNHNFECCESVYLEDIAGDIDDILGLEIVDARVETNKETHPEDVNLDKLKSTPDDFQWTFYRISTRQGTVVLRWYGTSNGYYSTDVKFHLVEN